MQILYVFIDVSGNYDFSNKGTKYIVLTSLVCTDVCLGIIDLHKLKHELIENGLDIMYFHACEDRQVVRNRVFNLIGNLGHIRIDSIIVEKRKTGPKLRPLNKFYPEMIKQLLKYPFDSRGLDIKQYDRVIIFVDSESSKSKERATLTKAVKVTLQPYLLNVPYTICMHSSATHPYLQIVDYCSWAIYRKWETGDLRPFAQIMPFVKSQFEIFEQGGAVWY
jgi:hypothetical protein